MKKRTTAAIFGSILTCLCLIAGGCGGKAKSDKSDAKSNGGKTAGETPPAVTHVEQNQEPTEPKVAARKPIDFGDPPETPKVVTKTGGNNGAEKTYTSVSDALKPLQVLVGEWNGIVQVKKSAEFQGNEAPVWHWDFSKKDQPALAFSMKDCTYFRNGRLTYLLDSQAFELTAEDRSGKTRVYRGNYTEPVRDEPGEGKKLHRKFKLTLTQVKPPLGVRDKLARVEFNKNENNRYLLLIHRKAGRNIRLAETVGNQRKGTSFAASLDDYGDKTCVVTQGLGTMTVSYKGKSYYVCCSGCKKTFEDDPEMWIASFEKWKRENGKK